MSSEEKAERLYGEAPEGDEAVDASREVPDPGERSWSSQKVEPYKDYLLVAMPKQFHAAQLDGYHLGQRISVTEERDGTRYGAQGILTSVQHGASLISERSLGSNEETVVLGQHWVQVTFGEHHGARVKPTATVELLD